MTEPDNTCPMIDDGIKTINTALEILGEVRNYTEMEDISNGLDDIVRELGEVEDNFEACRENCIDLREWGQFQEREFEEAEKTIYDLETNIRDLENILEDVRDGLKNAERVLEEYEN